MNPIMLTCEASTTLPHEVSMSFLRALDEWLGQNIAPGLSWLLVGTSIQPWVDAWKMQDLPCPAYFLSWLERPSAAVEDVISALNDGELMIPSVTAYGEEVDLSLVQHLMSQRCPGRRNAVFNIKIYCEWKAPGEVREKCGQLVNEEALEGMLTRNDVNNDVTLDMLIPMADSLDILEIDDILW
ncbi:hypothetical protein AC1031_021321 [Aphanomyces cochlioides]|nr:hypothetical protein AC1031_021321 [Aphanomyces cochlioides]